MDGEPEATEQAMNEATKIQIEAGSMWRKQAERARVVKIEGARVQIVSRETGERSWIMAEDFRATWKPVEPEKAPIMVTRAA